jgi:hypothetical protein
VPVVVAEYNDVVEGVITTHRLGRGKGCVNLKAKDGGNTTINVHKTQQQEQDSLIM